MRKRKSNERNSAMQAVDQAGQRIDVRTALSGGHHTRASEFLLRYRLLLVIALTLAALAGVGLWRYTSSLATVSYLTEPVIRGSLTVLVTATGAVQPTNEVDVSSELSGTIRKVHVDYNSTVTAGQILAELDAEKLTAAVASSRAKLTAAKAKAAEAQTTLAETKGDLRRVTELSQKKVVSQHDLEAAQAAHERAESSVAIANADIGVAVANLQLDETNLAKTVIVSPITGVILARNIEPGQTVAASLQAPILFSIAEDLRQMELQVDVDEADVGQVRVGQPATFSVDAFPDQTFPATIRDIRFAPETIQGVVTYKAVLTIDNSQLLLRPGMTATSEIRVTEIADALLVANAALRYAPPNETADERSLLQRFLPGPPRIRPISAPEADGPNRSVWVLRDNEPVEIAISIGPSDGARTQVVDGDLKPGDAVIVDQTTSK